jgi:hypothetical protein
MQAEAVRLNMFKIDADINSPINWHDWIRKNVAPIFPVREVRGPNGLYWAYMDWTATRNDAVTDLSADTREVVRTSSVRLEPDSEIANEITLEYQHAAATKRYGRSRTVTGKTGIASYGRGLDARVFATYRCQVSQQPAWFGIRRKSLKTSIIWDTATARAALEALAARLALPRRRLTISGGRALEALRIGAPVLYTDSEIDLSAAICVVDSVSVGSAGTSVALIIQDDPIRSARKIT